METYPFPKCCRAYVLCDWGAGHLNEADEASVTYEEALVWIREKLRLLKVNGTVAVFACPTGAQPGAVQALLECGFITTEERPSYSYALDAAQRAKGWRDKHEIIPMILDLSRYEPKR